jgi:hypothetical protein
VDRWESTDAGVFSRVGGEISASAFGRRHSPVRSSSYLRAERMYADKCVCGSLRLGLQLAPTSNHIVMTTPTILLTRLLNDKTSHSTQRLLPNITDIFSRPDI